MPSKHREQITSYSEEEAARLSQAKSNDTSQKSEPSPSARDHINTSDIQKSRAATSTSINLQ